MDLFRLKGRIAMITGSSRGLGLAMARGLAEAGAEIILNGMDKKRLGSTLDSIKTEGFTAHAYPFDVRDPAAVNAQVEAIEDEVGPIDILVNNAGINIRRLFEDYAEEEWRSILDTNLFGVIHVTQAVGKRMIARRRGKVINTTSVSSTISRPKIIPYVASKGGLKMLTKGLAVEWAPYNIQVNAIGPGWFATDETAELTADDEFDEWVRRRTPAGRWGRPVELVGTVVYLASNASDFVTGQTVYVDGGWLSSS